jgi:hypothetical protein
MGIEFEQFVHPERISKQLICPICTCVLENPVQTDDEHLFCENELLEWMTRSNLCPVSHTELKPDSIRKPGRIILNMLAELEMFCPYKANGCCWVGQNEHLQHHKKKCEHRSSLELITELSCKDNEITNLKEILFKSEKKCQQLFEQNSELQVKLKICESKLRVYDAFMESRSDSKKDEELFTSSIVQKNCIEEEKDLKNKSNSNNNNKNNIDLKRLSRLKALNLSASNGDCKDSKNDKYENVLNKNIENNPFYDDEDDW